MTDAALLPHQAAVTLDAIARVGYRRLISRRRLLQWTAQATHWRRRGSRGQSLFVAGLAISSLLPSLRPGSSSLLPQRACCLLLPGSSCGFFLSSVGWFLNLRPVEQKGDLPLPEADRRLLRQVARRTWHFSRPLSTRTPRGCRPIITRLPIRTAWPCGEPTNIGLWMASALGAYDSGSLTIDQV